MDRRLWHPQPGDLHLAPWSEAHIEDCNPAVQEAVQNASSLSTQALYSQMWKLQYYLDWTAVIQIKSIVFTILNLQILHTWPLRMNSRFRNVNQLLQMHA